MGQPPLDSKHIYKNTANAKTSHLNSIPVVTKTPYPKPPTQPTESSKRTGREHVPEDLESDPSFLESSSCKSDFSDDSKCRKSISKSKPDSSNDSKYRKPKIKKINKNKKRRKRKRIGLVIIIIKGI